MYSRPSTDVIVPPCALRKKIGVPPTPLKARTGLCTPPGDTRRARSKYSRERSSVATVAGLGFMLDISASSNRNAYLECGDLSPPFQKLRGKQKRRQVATLQNHLPIPNRRA